MLGYLLDPFIQINNVNGTPIVGAKIYVYNADTTNLAITYNDFEGHLNTNPVITDDFGNATIIADDGIEYDISVLDENDLLLFTKKYISIDKTSSAGGNTQVVAGYGVTVNRVGNTFTVSIDTDLIATKDDLADKQDKLQGGANIEITNDNTINVIGRSELVVQEPLRLTREQNKLKLFVDNNIETLYKTVQTPAAYGGNTGNYISRIQQNPNGEITCEVSDLSDIAAYQAGDNITIVGHTINGRDWTPELNQKVDNTVYNAYVAEHLDDDNTPYTAGANINITNHVVSGKNWTNEINNAATANGWDVTPYTAGSNIVVSNHTINGKDWTNTINNAATTNEWDVTPYSAGNFIGITGHKIEGYNWASYINNAATRNSWDVTPYVASTGISIIGHQISCTGDITSYTAGTGISVSNHKISCTGDITPYTAGTGISVSNHKISCTGDITAYTGGTGISVSNHQISCTGDITPYTAGTGLLLDNHQFSVDTSQIARRSDIKSLQGSTYVTVINSSPTSQTIALNDTFTSTYATKEDVRGLVIAGKGIASTTTSSGSKYIYLDITKNAARIQQNTITTLVTELGAADIFSILVKHEANNSISQVFVKNNNSASRNIYTFVNYTGKSTITPGNTTAIRTIDGTYDTFELMVMCMGTGGELPVYKYIIAVESNSSYADATVYRTFSYDNVYG
jgi:hypothetical protein